MSCLQADLSILDLCLSKVEEVVPGLGSFRSVVKYFLIVILKAVRRVED